MPNVRIKLQAKDRIESELPSEKPAPEKALRRRFYTWEEYASRDEEIPPQTRRSNHVART